MNELVNLVSGIGALGLALWILWQFFTGNLVAKERLDEMRTQRDKAIDLATAATKANERLADLWEARNQAEERIRRDLGLYPIPEPRTEGKT